MDVSSCLICNRIFYDLFLLMRLVSPIVVPLCLRGHVSALIDDYLIMRCNHIMPCSLKIYLA